MPCVAGTWQGPSVDLALGAPALGPGRRAVTRGHTIGLAYDQEKQQVGQSAQLWVGPAPAREPW